jgi:hypothetical protein
VQVLAGVLVQLGALIRGSFAGQCYTRLGAVQVIEYTAQVAAGAATAAGVVLVVCATIGS